ncbi:hypothetical protein ACLB1N_31375 [Escherichia coli]
MATTPSLRASRGQRHWTDQYPNGDAAEAILNSSFDWNGVREPFVVATENDSLNGVAMLMVTSSPAPLRYLPMCVPTGHQKQLSV